MGEKGVTLSGGQKARLSLARAVYCDADIYLLDDPISAVDSKVAREIFDKCIKQFKKTKIIVLVTHQISFLYECCRVVIMENGGVIANDTPENLKEKLAEIEESYEEDEIDEEEKKIIEDLR